MLILQENSQEQGNTFYFLMYIDKGIDNTQYFHPYSSPCAIRRVWVPRLVLSLWQVGCSSPDQPLGQLLQVEHPGVEVLPQQNHPIKRRLMVQTSRTGMQWQQLSPILHIILVKSLVVPLVAEQVVAEGTLHPSQ